MAYSCRRKSRFSQKKIITSTTGIPSTYLTKNDHRKNLCTNFLCQKSVTSPVAVSYSVHEGKHFLFQPVSGQILKLIDHRAGTIVHLLLLKLSMVKSITCKTKLTVYVVSLKIFGKLFIPGTTTRNFSRFFRFERSTKSHM